MFLRRLATRILEIDRGQLFDWSCDYDTFLERKQAVLDAETVQWARFDKKLAQEEVWLRQGVKARRTRNEGRVTALEKMREARFARRERTGTARMQIQEAERSGKLVVETEGVSFSYGGRPVIRDLSCMVMRGDKVGIIGPNGAGKTTLFNAVAGAFKPSSGQVVFDGRDITGLPADAVCRLGMARTFQVTRPFAAMTCLENIMVAAVNRHPRKPRSFIEDYAREKLGLVGLAGMEGFEARQLNVVQKKRLEMARAIATAPKLLMLDEVLGGLNTQEINQASLRGIIYDRNGVILARNVASYNVVITPASLPQLESLFLKQDPPGAVQRIYSAAGNVAWVGWQGDAAPLEAGLEQLGLCGLALLGPAGERLWYGVRRSQLSAMTVGCAAGAFDLEETCICESLVNDAHGSAAMVCNSRNGYYEPGSLCGSSQHFHRQFVDARYGEGIVAAGRRNVDSKADLVWMLDDVMRYVHYELHLFGDPALPQWADVLGELALEHSGKYSIAEGSYAVTVTAGGAPVPGATVTVYSDDFSVRASGETDDAGAVLLEPSVRKPMTLHLKAVKADYLPAADDLRSTRK